MSENVSDLWFKQLGLTKVYPAYDEYKTCEDQVAEIQGLP